jgi:hypothetical protein
VTYRWMPIFGNFEVSDSLVFHGTRIPRLMADGKPSPTETMATVGLLLSDQKMVNGQMSATVIFEDDQDNVFELILSYDLNTRAMITGGIGGDGYMGAIREWIPVSGPQETGPLWNDIAIVGMKTDLKANTPYDVSVTVAGSMALLEVNGVPIASTRIPSKNNQTSPVGIFCVSSGDMTITNVRFKPEKPKAFIVMQFSAPYDDVYKDAIKIVCDEFNLDAIRADEIYGPGLIIRDIVQRILESQIIIADISPSNPNVYFEVGYALALNKPIILLAERRPKDNPLPFDLSPFRVLFYDNSIGGKSKLEEGLRNHLREILGLDSPT